MCFETKQKGKIAKMSILNNKIVFENKMLYSLLKSIKKLKNKGGCQIENNGVARLMKDISGNNNTIKIAAGCVLSDTHIRIIGNNNTIEFKDNCKVGEGCSFWLEGNNITIVIGNNSTFTKNIHFCAQEDYSKIIVGEDCMFSNNIIVRTSDSHAIFNLETGIRINYPKNVYIGNHVWIAPSTKIMKGSQIGDGTIIGSDSMVNSVVPENVLAVGHPANVVKRNISWSREELF